MGRHHKPTDLFPSSSYPTGFSRNSLTIRGVKCCIWWPANKIPSVVPLAVIACFLVCLKLIIVQIWCLGKLPEDHNQYPGGFTCPDSTHKILDHRNVTISCKPCLECPLGKQLLPPCGSLTKSKTSIECRECPPDTYKESQGTGKCKPCQTCGLREIISQCTPEKNALCGECPRGYYQEDYTLESCKRCATCCGVKRFAELECIYLKQCLRKNCTQQLKIKESSALKLEDVTKLLATGSTAHERAVTQGSASRSDYPAPARNWILVDIVPQLKKSKFKREVNVKMQRAESGKSSSQRVAGANTYSLKGNNSTPQNKLYKGFATVSDASVGEPTMQSISSNTGNVGNLLTILIVLVGIAIMLSLTAIIMAWKNQSGHCPGSSCTVTCYANNIYFTDVDERRSLMRDKFQTDSEIAYASDNGVAAATSSENNAEIDDIENLALFELPPTLENILIKKLDVPHKGEYGWKKLGKAFEIDHDDLTYLETAYKRSVGSPTKELLEILDKNQCRTVGEVLNKLKGSYVNHPDVARLIRQKWQEI